MPASAVSERQRKRMSRARIRNIVVTVILMPIAILWIYPLLWMVSASLKTNAEIFCRTQSTAGDSPVAKL